MRKTFIAVAALIAAALTGAMTAPEAAARNSSFASEAFWRCPSGYLFESSSNAVHCKKAAYTDHRSLAPCMTGLYAATDHIGTKDMCSATNAITGELGVERACKPEDAAAGYSKRIVSGVDFCGKAIPQTVIAPSVMVTLTT